MAMALAARGDFLATSTAGGLAPACVGVGLTAAALAAVFSFLEGEDLAALVTDEGAVFAGFDFLAEAEVLAGAEDALPEREAVGVLTTAFLTGAALVGAAFLEATVFWAAGFLATSFLATAFFVGNAFFDAAGFLAAVLEVAAFFTGNGFLAVVFFGVGLAATGFFTAAFLAGAGFLTAALDLAVTGFLTGALVLAFAFELALCLVCFTVLLLSTHLVGKSQMYDCCYQIRPCHVLTPKQHDAGWACGARIVLSLHTVAGLA
ncbi:MAG: hypothetical protein RL700_978 [Pseudomonadota bacterium]